MYKLKYCGVYCTLSRIIDRMANVNDFGMYHEMVTPDVTCLANLKGNKLSTRDVYSRVEDTFGND